MNVSSHSLSSSRAFRVYALIACVMALCFLNCSRKGNDKNLDHAKTTIQVKGSDTMVNVAQAWAEEYNTIDTDVNIEVSGGGSGVGIAALIKGAIDIANASRNMKEGEVSEAKISTGKNPREFIIGYDALAVFVHKDNPLNEISLEELARIFGEDGTVTHWSQLGVNIPGTRTDKIIRVSRQSSSGTYEFFRERVMHNKDFKLGSCDMNGSKEAVELVGNTKNAIGYSGMGYATHDVKMLRISINAGDTAVAPTLQNTLDKKYPLARSLNMYTLGEPEGAVKKYIDWILSTAGQKIVENSGYVPNNPSRANL